MFWFKGDTYLRAFIVQATVSATTVMFATLFDRLASKHKQLSASTARSLVTFAVAFLACFSSLLTLRHLFGTGGSMIDSSKGPQRSAFAA